MRKNEKIGYGVENFKKNKKNYMWSNTWGAHLTLWGRRVILPPPPSINYTHHLYTNYLISTNVTFVSIAYIISNQLLRNTSLTTTA